MLRVKQGDITKVTGFQAIINPANNSLLGGGGIDGSVHRAAGPQLKSECRRLNGCETGDSRLTLAYNLPCKYIIHSVGPVWSGGMAGEEELLASCYLSALKIAADNGIRKLAMASISTGDFGYPVEEASKVAVSAVLSFLKDHPDSFDDLCWIVPDANSCKAYSEEIKAMVPKPAKASKKKVKEAVEVVEEEPVAEEENAVQEEATAQEETSVKEEAAVQGKVTEQEVAATQENAGVQEDAAAQEVVSPQKEETVQEESAAQEVTATEEPSAEATTQAEAVSEEIPAEAGSAPVGNAMTGVLRSSNGVIWNKYSIDWLIRDIEKGIPHRYLCLEENAPTGETAALLLTDTSKVFHINGRRYRSVLQYVASEKALLFDDTLSYKCIMAEADQDKIKNLFLNIIMDEIQWQDALPEILFRGYLGKMLADDCFREHLVHTGNSMIIYAGSDDEDLGVSLSKSELLTPEGTLKVLPTEWHRKDSKTQERNFLGFALMAVRDYLK